MDRDRSGCAGAQRLPVCAGETDRQPGYDCLPGGGNRVHEPDLSPDHACKRDGERVGITDLTPSPLPAAVTAEREGEGEEG
ncbi:hypothetical protein CCP3SC1AL1_770013 [Gammaproteobacteria bacterium]